MKLQTKRYFKQDFKQWLINNTDLINHKTTMKIEDFFEVPLEMQFGYLKKFFKKNQIYIDLKSRSGLYFPQIKGQTFIRCYEDKNESLFILFQKAINIYEERKERIFEINS